MAAARSGSPTSGLGQARVRARLALVHALRLLLWMVPALAGVSVLSYLALSLIVDPADDPAVAQSLSPAELIQWRRERFLDLPRFINGAPRDVRTRSLAAVDTLVSEPPESQAADGARAELARLGGAAFPHVLPHLDALSPESRARVALALVPVAERMRVGRDEVGDPTRTAGFWMQLWADRGVEFRQATRKSAVERVVRYGSESRIREIEELDTYVLPAVIDALGWPVDARGIARIRVLSRIAAHVTGVDDALPEAADLAAARACVTRWQRYWTIYGSDFQEFTGATRVLAMVTATRYGKWAMGVMRHGLDTSADGALAPRDLPRRARSTLTLSAAAVSLGYVLAVAVALLAAARRANRLGAATIGGAATIAIVPAGAIIAVVAAVESPWLILPSLVLGAALFIAPTSHLWLALRRPSPAVAALARSGSLGGLVSQSARVVLGPSALRTAAELLLALGGALLVEHLFGVEALGEATLRAARSHDITWLMAMVVLVSAVLGLGYIASDVNRTLSHPPRGPLRPSEPPSVHR